MDAGDARSQACSQKAASPTSGVRIWPSALADRRDVGHQAAIARLAREAHDDDPAGLDAGDDTFAEVGVDDVVADMEDRGVALGLRGGGGRRRPRSDPPRRREAAGDPGRLVGQLDR